jgi:hypothetical protein
MARQALLPDSARAAVDGEPTSGAEDQAPRARS